MSIKPETRWIDKNTLVATVISIHKEEVLFEFENKVRCILNKNTFLATFSRYIGKVKSKKKYNKQTPSDIYGGEVLIDKSVLKVEEIVNQLEQLIQESPYTLDEVAERLEWDVRDLKMVLSGDGDEGLNIHQITHIAGALGFDFSIVFKKEV